MKFLMLAVRSRWLVINLGKLVINFGIWRGWLLAIRRVWLAIRRGSLAIWAKWLSQSRAVSSVGWAVSSV